MKIKEGTIPKEIISDNESRLLPNSAQLLFLLAKNPSKLSKKIHTSTILEASNNSPLRMEYMAKNPKVPLINVKISGKETKFAIPGLFMISFLIKFHAYVLFNGVQYK
ncbi:MAG: hypothetical protein AMQ22_00775 [Candidatus Methanofastidiosum methylothiophilum]|uniref:Uncharacterized protein n=1 Tax=Candidatus Methanofastidiosum methylothiophilum TaxID=1705564 RepID=A0A150J5W2_9EURY|nr:MAG: hypothetical protein AMQ22_00775 [Candidatus Methanofastidiosum methylthiophilus]